MDQQFDNVLVDLKTLYTKRIEQIERDNLAALHVKDERIMQLEEKVKELSKTADKLAGFRQSIISSFGEDDIYEMLPSNASPVPQHTPQSIQPEVGQTPIARNNFESNLAITESSANNSPRLYLKKELNEGNASSLGLVKSTENVGGGGGSLGFIPAPREPSTVVDGKEFFKTAKQTLSSQDFQTLLSNCKALNAKKITKYEGAFENFNSK
jgi:hypothetical protein